MGIHARVCIKYLVVFLLLFMNSLASNTNVPKQVEVCSLLILKSKHFIVFCVQDRILIVLGKKLKASG